jgi:hypothetical protein
MLPGMSLDWEVRLQVANSIMRTLHAKPDATGKKAGEREFRNSLTQCLDGILAEGETMPTVSKGGFRGKCCHCYWSK